jgi:cytochrome c-type biogenesis protein CcsB
MKISLRFWLIALTAMLALTPRSRADDFADQVDLSPLHVVAVQHNETMKTLDTFSREVIEAITGRSTLDGRDPVFTLMDMSFHPENYVQRNIIKIVNIPLRKDFELLDSIDTAEKTRIEHEGTVSLAFLESADVLNLLQKDQAESVVKTNAINQVFTAMQTLHEVCEGDDRGFIPAAIIPPAQGSDDPLWHRPSEMLALLPGAVDHFKELGQDLPAAPAGYDAEQPTLSKIFAACGGLLRGWDARDINGTNSSARELADLLPQINPGVYPSHAKREVEVAYNRLMRLTIPGAAFYLIAFILFVLSANADVRGFRLWGLRFMIVAFAIHTTGIAIRWWLVGSVFPPIKNEFESVMCSAWFGALVALILELRKSRGLFGAAGSFVGSLALIAIFAAPYVAGKQIGGEIAPVQGILMSYWLYIHVTMVTGSYSLIGMGFLLSSWWLIRYYRQKPAKEFATAAPGGSGRYSREAENLIPSGGGAVAMGFARTLAMTLFIPQPRATASERISESALRGDTADQSFLQTLDKCNLVVLQLAFWMLGAGIMLGAIWADQSWGRPWGWDPKETFALITWIVYLVAVHVRVAVADKAWWTAVLGCVGFFVMLFNWIGVNFFLVGLHSYA